MGFDFDTYSLEYVSIHRGKPVARISFEEAKKRYQTRHTFEFTPEWAKKITSMGGTVEASVTDLQWYNITKFPGEDGIPETSPYCLTRFNELEILIFE